MLRLNKIEHMAQKYILFSDQSTDICSPQTKFPHLQSQGQLVNGNTNCKMLNVLLILSWLVILMFLYVLCL